MARRWTAQEGALLRSTWNNGAVTDESLGGLLNRSAGAISNRRSKIGAVKYTKMKKKDNDPFLQDGPLFDPDFSNAASRALNQPMPTRPFPGCGPARQTEITVREVFQMEGIPPGSEAFLKMNHCGQVEFQAIGIPPRHVARILAQIISKIV